MLRSSLYMSYMNHMILIIIPYATLLLIQLYSCTYLFLINFIICSQLSCSILISYFAYLIYRWEGKSGFLVSRCHSRLHALHIPCCRIHPQSHFVIVATSLGPSSFCHPSKSSRKQSPPPVFRCRRDPKQAQSWNS